MAATRRDDSGVFGTELKAKHSRKAAVLEKVSHLSQNGVTFSTERSIPEWMEVGVKMHLPKAAARRDQHVGCRGVVVQCLPRQKDRRFEVSLVFLDLPERIGSQLAVSPDRPSHICINC